MELPALNPNLQSMDLALGQAGSTRLQELVGRTDASAEDREGLEKAAKQFEGVFLNQLLKAMRATVPENEMFNSGGPTKFYQQMCDAEMARALADQDQGMGIASLIIGQFAATVDASAAGDAAAVGPAAPGPLTALPETGLERYRQAAEGEVGGARLIRLRRMAQTQEPAVADTLRRYEGEILGAARRTGLDPALLLAVVMEESGGDPDAESPRGARGLMQLMPATAREMGVTDPGEPGANLSGGAGYLQRMLDRYDGRRDLALAAYNAGPGNVDRAGGRIPDFPETRNYVEKVEARYRKLTGGTEMAIPDRWSR